MPNEPSAAPRWRKSSRSEFNTCVEVCFSTDLVAVRNSNSPEGTVVKFSHAEWVAFLEGVALGEFDPPGPGVRASTGR